MGGCHHVRVTDTLSQQGRSERMSLIRGGDTTPEWVVRRIVHSMGFRYRLHVKTLPGKPDLVFPRLRKVIFVHGCFWHRHRKARCKLARPPKSRLEFWGPRLEGNRLRDLASKRALRKLGWAVLEVWECELKNSKRSRGNWGMFGRMGITSAMTTPTNSTTSASDELYRKVANQVWCSDKLEVDPDAAVSPSDHGAWVHAWVWVSNKQAGLKSGTV